MNERLSSGWFLGNGVLTYCEAGWEDNWSNAGNMGVLEVSKMFELI